MQGQRNSMGALPENLFFGTYEQNRPRRHTLPSNQNSMQFLQHSGFYDPNVEWISGESSSNASQHQANICVRKPEDPWNFSSSGVLSFENQQYEPSSSTTLSLDHHAELNSNRNPTFMLMGLPFPPAQNSGDCSSLENQDKSRKRKAPDFNMGQSSNNGIETRQWPAQIASGNTNTSLQTENDDIVIGNASNPSTSRQRLVIGGPESSSRNLRLHGSGSGHQVPQQTTYSDVRNMDGLSSNHSSRPVHNCFLGLNPTPEVETMNNLHMQPASFRLPDVHRNWRLPSISRLISSSSSSSYHPMPEERGPPVLERSGSRNIPEHPMLLSSVVMGNPSQSPAYLNLANRNLASSSRASPRTGLNPPETNQLNRTHAHRPRRLSEANRRPLLASSGTEPDAQNGPHSSPSGLGGLGHRARSVLLERQANATFGLPRSLRTLGATTADERRNMPEHVRRILDIMRRGEELRFEDLAILDHPAFIAMADMHDRHRDMRMDVDNMSYEELLALEERIGDVCTGLSEESIMKHMKQHKYTNDHARCQEEPEPCSICREEYIEGEDMGKLECGHDFHRDCIKQWLKNKNLCPICKTPGLST